MQLADKHQGKIIESLAKIDWVLAMWAQEQVNQGKTGQQIADDIKAKFGYGPDNRRL